MHIRCLPRRVDHRHSSRRLGPFSAENSRSKLAALALAVVALAVVTFVASAALALMPPHTTRAEPGEGGELAGRTLIFHGYSLDYADKVAIALDVEAKRTVATTVEISCEWVGKGDCAGNRTEGCDE